MSGWSQSCTHLVMSSLTVTVKVSMERWGGGGGGGVEREEGGSGGGGGLLTSQQQ